MGYFNIKQQLCNSEDLCRRQGEVQDPIYPTGKGPIKASDGGGGEALPGSRAVFQG